MSLRVAALAMALSAACHDPDGSVPHEESSAASGPVGERAELAALFARGYYPGRSGQIFFVLEAGEVLLRRPMGLYRFMHGGPWEYDRHVPLLFFGPGQVEAGEEHLLVTQQHVAPTVLSLVGLPAGAAMAADALDIRKASPAPLRAVVVVVLDGFRADYLERYESSLETLGRLRREGAYFSRAWIDYLPTVTSAGHATIATGADPRHHGISGNGYYDRRVGETRTLFEDLSPAHMRTPGLADLWATGVGAASVILVQGTTPRATVSLAGHGRCRPNGRAVAMAMFDYRSASWTTNPDCYTLPMELTTRNARPIWESTPRRYRDLELDSGRAFVTTDLFPEFQIDALVSMLESESFGRDDVADLALVNMKTPDYVGHYYGPDSDEMRDALQAVDNGLARVLDALAASSGDDGFVVVVTADHGMPSEPDAAAGRQRRFIRELNRAVHDALDPDEASLLFDYVDTANLQLYVDEVRLQELGLTLDDVAKVVSSQPYVVAAFTEDEIRAVDLDRRH